MYSYHTAMIFLTRIKPIAIYSSYNDRVRLYWPNPRHFKIFFQTCSHFCDGKEKEWTIKIYILGFSRTWDLPTMLYPCRNSFICFTFSHAISACFASGMNHESSSPFPTSLDSIPKQKEFDHMIKIFKKIRGCCVDLQAKTRRAREVREKLCEVSFFALRTCSCNSMKHYKRNRYRDLNQC